jgi:hypothetical protein
MKQKITKTQTPYSNSNITSHHKKSEAKAITVTSQK